MARSILEDPVYLHKLKQRLLSGKAQRIEELLYQYADGKPTQNVQVAAERTLEELVLGSMELDKAEQGKAGRN